jgi:deoxyribonuclease V
MAYSVALRVEWQAMIACVDVDYRWNHCVAACVVLDTWEGASSRAEHVVRVEGVVPYDRDVFELRELPPIMAVLAQCMGSITCVVVDAYVWLDGARRRGLGAHLYERLDASVAVVGVAKRRLPGALAREVFRGNSTHPLWVSVAGATPDEAERWLRSMHGAHRTPTALARVDRLCRGAHVAPPSGAS